MSIEGSGDGLKWLPLGSLEPFITSREMISAYERLTQTNSHHSGYFRVELTPPAEPITHLRVRSENGGFGVREISFFE
jgi:hypothetical protein